MEILILSNNDAGLFLFRRELISELLKRNSVTIVAPTGPYVNELVGMGCSYIDVRLDRRTKNFFKDIKLFLTYLRLMRTQKPDIVMTYTIKPNIYGGFACRLVNIPYYVNITGLGTAFQKEGFLKRLVTTMYKISLKKAYLIFFENQENREIFIENNIVNEKQTCLLMGAGVNLDTFPLQIYPKDGMIRFIYIGRIMIEKGVDELFEAAEKLKKDGAEFKLDIVGDFEESYGDKISELEKRGIVEYHGYQQDVRPFIKRAHCGVLPSWHEGMSNANLECAACGRPIITSKISGCKEAVEENISGYLCEIKDANNLYHVMKKFINLSYEEKRQMGIEGRKRMEKLFDRRLVVKKTIDRMKL